MAVTTVFLLSCRGPAKAEETSCPQEALVLGMSTALSGPAAQLGLNMQTGVLAALAEKNRAGGVRGRPLCLHALDDGYEPAQTVPNMLQLIEREGVLAVVGNVGTPTAVAASPIAARYKTLFYGAYTGAGVLRKNPPDRYIVNFRASYEEETAAMVDALIEEGGLAPDEIALFTQRDAYGDAGFSGALAAFKRHGLKEARRIVHARYERNTIAVETGLADILLAQPTPKAVIMVGAYAPCAAFVKLAKESGLDALFLTVSFVGGAPLAEALGEDGEGVIITQVVPHFDADLPLVKEFRQALHDLGRGVGPTFGALEGYISTRILLRAMDKMDGEPTRESIITALEKLGEFDMGLGVPLKLSRDEHQASHRVWPTIIHHGLVVPFDWQGLRRGP